MTNLKEILKICGNIDSIIKADHIMEIPGLGEVCGYCFNNHTCEKTTECFK